ncbi:SMPD1 [Lepeophtheirus salmonis]|uniref:Sphingomyelin phosphodiesterase n=1 Tax=Lepeophtheirus salmonis TaxID=72036 RepID=A0A7R8CYW2_LEPSM|nr:SMPD1 [Lepeophtheirus salmonis]CAF2971987.1 SMPD1 [Lepeophtheirus salmonis]
MRALIVVLSVISCVLSSSNYLDKSLEASIIKSLTSNNPYEISNTLKDLAPAAHDYFRGRNVRLNQAQNTLLCSGCNGGIQFFLTTVKQIGFDKTAKRIKKLLCPALALLNIFSKKVCKQTIDVFSPEVKFLIKNGKLESKKMCSFIFGAKCGEISTITDWNIDLNSSQPSTFTTESFLLPKKTSKILQITDVHLDLEYKVGSNAACKDPLCCRNENDKPKKPGMKQESGDITIESNPEGFEYILFTGDNTPHDIWAQSRTANLDYSNTVFEAMRKVFPNQRIFPIIGNHETFPVNNFPPHNLQNPQFEPSWLYNGIANLTSEWLTKESLITFKKFGHYSELLESGLRVIAINSNVCFNLNFWLNYDHVDLGGQLNWLMKELFKAETNNEKVHILSHVPPGSDECYGTWGREYSKIVNRFANTIIAQFYGHTHVDEFVVFYDQEERPTNVGFVTPSITTYTDVNPSYRIFTMERSNSSTFRIIDYDTHIMDLKKSNEADDGLYFSKLYSAKEDLEMESLSPKNFDKLVHRLTSDNEFYNKYLRYVVSNGTLPMKRKDVICRLVTTSSSDEKNVS